MARPSDPARRAWLAAARAAVTNVAERTLGEAVDAAPIREGTLRGSADLEIDERGDTVTAEISFNTVYAARQHEEMDWNHPLGGGPKYLERALQRNARLLEAGIAVELRKRGL